jgi:hypothetical protein
VSRSTPATQERIKFVVQFASFTVAISAATLLLSSVFFIVEASVYVSCFIYRHCCSYYDFLFLHFRYQWHNWTSWLVEQVFMRSLEAAYAIGTLIALRKIPPHEVMPERRGLLHDSPAPQQHPGI